MMSNNSVKNNDVASIRREYARQTLRRDDVAADPIEQFDSWFKQAKDADLPDVNAMTLATATADARPSSRIVLLKGYDGHGFRFYTNYTSRKGAELEKNPQAALCFLWSGLERQVRIEGPVKKVSAKESEAYFHNRPRKSQLGAWASHQSSEVASREELEKGFEAVKKQFEGGKVPYPDFWGGFQVMPEHIEFWQGRQGRLHDRIIFNKENDKSWYIRRLCP